MSQGCSGGCQHLPPVQSLEDLFKYAQVQCNWTEVYARELGWNIKKSINDAKRISIACSVSSKNCVSTADIREYFGIEEGRFKIKCNKAVNGITLIRSSFPGEYCPNFEQCNCFILRQLDQEKFRNLWWLERLICKNTTSYLDSVRTELLSSNLYKELNPFSQSIVTNTNNTNTTGNTSQTLPALEVNDTSINNNYSSNDNEQQGITNTLVSTINYEPFNRTEPLTVNYDTEQNVNPELNMFDLNKMHNGVVYSTIVPTSMIWSKEEVNNLNLSPSKTITKRHKKK